MIRRGWPLLAMDILIRACFIYPLLGYFLLTQPEIYDLLLSCYDRSG